MSLAAKGRMKNPKIARDVFSRIIVYIDSDPTYPYQQRFAEIFGDVGYIPGYNLRTWKQPQPLRYIQYLSVCSGIGVGELALQCIFPNAECVGYFEVDKDALAVYQHHFPNHTNLGDVTKCRPEQLADFDLIIGGIPCQPFSTMVCNHHIRKNHDDLRAEPFKHYVRILKAKKPHWFLMECVSYMEKEMEQ
ncbi:DNA (cytosine-5-)-methyltransferase [Spizellomyces sp. 'palustris']|nr:DNA (cytosine-5-)-methyltransferase [Spizellomyces sp. 'palustris']